MHNRLQRYTLLTLKNHNFVITTAVISETPIIVSIMTILFGKMTFEKIIVSLLHESKENCDNHGEWIDK